MAQPLVSVVIPAYNNAIFLGDAIQSVLDQTYPNFELIVVNDASPDNVEDVVKSFDDTRIKYIVHERNMGLSAARNTGIRNSVGNYVALLDGDDYFHPDKLRSHVEFFEKHPDIGTTYNARFELNHSSRTIRELWRPPTSVNLMDLVLGFPFGPSDMVVRREWAFRVDLFNEYYIYVGEDLDFNCRLALAGCKFASVDRALNYRRYHAGRAINDISYFVDCTFRALSAVFADPRCPDEVLAVKEKAFASHSILWSAIAFAQNDTKLGQEYCLAAIRGNPSFLAGEPNSILHTLILYSVVDESQDHEKLLQKMIAQLPLELSWMRDWYEWGVGRGYLLKFVRSMMWGRQKDGSSYFRKAVEWRAKIDRLFLQNLSGQLTSYEAEFGAVASQAVFELLSPFLEEIGSRADIKWLKGSRAVYIGFKNYAAGEYAKVPQAVIDAILSDPSHLLNRGVIKILLDSLMKYAF